MPLVTAAMLPFTLTAAAAGATTAGQIVGARAQSGASERAGQRTAQATMSALDYERENDRLEREQYQREYDHQIEVENEQRQQREEDRRIERDRFDISQGRLDADRAWDQQLYGEQQERLRPWQEAGQVAVRNISGLLASAPPVPVGRATRRITNLI